MSPTIERCKADEPVAAIADALEEHGAVIVEGALGADDRAAILAELEPFIGAADPTMAHLDDQARAFFGGAARHVAGVAGKSPTFAQTLLVHPALRACCDRVLLPSCARYQLNLAHLLVPGPGAQEQVLHRDEVLWHHVPRPHPPLMVACIAALVDFTEELGATRVVPGSHRWERGRKPTDADLAVAEMPAGSMVVYLGSTYHGAGANRTDQWRIGLHLSYLVGWLRTEDNNVLSTPPRLAATLPPEARDLIYARHEALGSVEELDPADLFDGGLAQVVGPVPALDGPEWAGVRLLHPTPQAHIDHDTREVR